MAQPALAYDSQTNKLFFHQTINTGAPADWLYDPVADTWTSISSGGGAASDQVMAYDGSNNVLIGYNYNSSNGIPEIWKGSISTSNPCDLNGDGVVDSLDVTLAINQALGLSACGTSDLVHNGNCSVVDVQRVIGASLGGTCKVGN